MIKLVEKMRFHYKLFVLIVKLKDPKYRHCKFIFCVTLVCCILHRLDETNYCHNHQSTDNEFYI